MDHALREGILCVRVKGLPDTRAFLQLLSEVAGDPRYPDGLPLLLDVRDASDGPSQDEMREVSEFFADHPAAFGTKAMLVKSKLQYGLARAGKALTQNRGMDLEIFHDEDAALQALRPPGGR